MGVITVRGVNFESYSSYLRTTLLDIVYQGGCMMHGSHFCARILIQRTRVGFMGVGIICKYPTSHPCLIYDVSRARAKSQSLHTSIMVTLTVFSCKLSIVTSSSSLSALTYQH
jgi:hypothetical protein